MSKRSIAVSVVYSFGIAVSALSIAAVHAPAAAQSANLLLCDRLAADPADPDKPADVQGVAAIAPSDVATAIKYCKSTAASSRRALYELGRAYAANQQWPEAIEAYRKAADKGSTSAMVELGILLASGSSVAKDEAQAHDLFERAAEAGNPRGVINLMAMAGNGGPPVDPGRARALLAQAAQANSAEAEFQLGLMDANGVGGPKDDVAARALFERAAAQGHPGALEWAGSFAESGRGGPKDPAAAKAYYEKAALLGNENAKTALERMRCSWTLTDKRGNTWGHICM
ncbi:MAG TPA: tetratricopeptide repeat protein [Xanthobacteraceae bacterium]|jgi:TPR repeat protein|nr:tetratricopeptide repeat protein [Xanthobacteraceae bacterium]